MAKSTPETEINLITEDGSIPNSDDIKDLADADNQAKLDQMLQKGQLQSRPDSKIRSRVYIQKLEKEGEGKRT